MANCLPGVATLTYYNQYYPGYEPAKTIDANPATSGSIMDLGGHPWWCFDMGESYHMTTVRATGVGSEWPTADGCTLQKSQNGLDWEDVVDASAAKTETVYLPEDQYARYWRVYSDGYNGWWTVAEWEMDGEAGTPPTASLTITPDPVWIGGGPILMEGTLADAAWTAGVPGSSTISVDHGTISEQWTSDSTTVHFTLTPAAYVGTLTFTESEYGAQDTVTASIDPDDAETAFLCQLEPDAAAYINRIPHGEIPALLSTDLDLRIPAYTASLLETLQALWRYLNFQLKGDLEVPPTELPYNPRLDAIWDAINGGVAQPVGLWSPTTDPPVKIDTENIRAAVEDMYQGGYTLPMVINTLRGAEAYDLTTITQLIAGLPDSHGLEILERLTEIQGPGVDTLYTLGVAIQDVRTSHNWTLDDVIQRLDDRPTKLQLDAWGATIMGSLGGLALEIAGLYKGLGIVEATSIFDTIAGILSDLLTGLGESAVNAFLNHILTKDVEGNTTRLNLPLWPGEDYVDWGEVVTLESNLPVVGDMHGVVVDVTGCESGTRFFDYDGIRNWSHIGALAFGSDNGYQEPFQALGAARGIYTVKTMERATYCRLFRDRLVRGTIRPWKRKPDIPVLG